MPFSQISKATIFKAFLMIFVPYRVEGIRYFVEIILH
jgi:hypothetical protein